MSAIAKTGEKGSDVETDKVGDIFLMGGFETGDGYVVKA